MSKNDTPYEHLIQSLDNIWRGDERYFLFPWVDDGNLRDFWSGNNNWALTPDLVSQILEQLLGLAHALEHIHRQNWRRGDIEPENILRFKTDTIIGQFKLGDTSVSKHHQVATEMRMSPTETRERTLRYEPPEEITAPKALRSRRYDLWSMGCVILEFIIWLQYDPSGLSKFNRSLQNLSGTLAAYYSVVIEDGRRGPRLRAELRKEMKQWLQQLRHDRAWNGKTAPGELSAFVETDLLVTQPPTEKSRQIQDSEEEHSRDPVSPVPLILVAGQDEELRPSPPCIRADATILVDKLSRIYRLPRSDSAYLLPVSLRSPGAQGQLVSTLQVAS